MKTKLHFVLSLSMFLSAFSILAQQSYWQRTNLNDLPNSNKVTSLNREFYKTFNLNIEELKAQLSNAPLRSSNITNSNSIFYLPNVKGGLEQFMIVEAPVLSEELSELYPSIKTYIGYSIENSGTRARFSVTPQGLQALVSYPNDTMNFIVPLSKTDSSSYIVYSREARSEGLKDFECLTQEELLKSKGKENAFEKDANDQILRTFRIAISTTGEYTNFWDDGNNANGNAQVDALAQVVSTLNRTNEVFEVDMAVTFKLVTGTEIIYPNANADPYTNNLNNQLQATLTTNVGEANYDIGHLFDFGGNNGNAGCIGCVCVDNSKGSGFSSHSFADNNGGAYMSDYFDIDYVPHEIGHQMGANHTWSFNSEGTGVNAEPGSGTTIMGYAGITGGNDVQDHSDPYFHYYTIVQILNNLQNRTCWVGTTIINSPPIADAGSDYIIPKGTAFVLKGSAMDSDIGDVLTYTWEQIDSGVTTSNNFSPNKASGPVWRSRPPTTTTDRYMPIIERVIADELTESNPFETIDNSSWETVSDVGRDLNFALTVRDRSEANGVGQMPQSSFDTMLVTVDSASGPFMVTSQNTNELWCVGSTQTITWDVAGTDTGIINTPTVNILLSIDGGFTYPYILATDISNDGSYDAIVPNIGGDTSLARVKVEGNNNIFYAINTTDFSIEEREFLITVANTDIDVCQTNDAIYNFTYNTFLGFNNVTNISVIGLPSGAGVSINPSSVSADNTTGAITINGLGSLALGAYPFVLQGVSGGITQTVDLVMNVYSSSINIAVLTSPSDNMLGLGSEVDLFWNTIDNAQDYLVEISTDANFASIFNSAIVQNATYTVENLMSNTVYYWRVTASNLCGVANSSSVFSFTTANVICNFDSATDLPITILEGNNGTDNYTSIINVVNNEVIVDVNVTINIEHDWNNDLDIFLISPSGTSVELSTDNGNNNEDDYTNTTFDQEAVTSIVDGTSPFTGTFIPEGDLSVLYGEMSGGNWTLSVDDDFAAQDGGQILDFTIELCTESTLSTNNFEIESLSFVIYPNPNDGLFNVRLDNPISDKIKVEIYDINGRIILVRDYNSTTSFNASINLKNVQSGIYLVKVIDGENQMSKKLIID